MKNVAKKGALALVIGFCLLLPVSALAGSYTNKYEFYGGVYGKHINIDKGKKARVKTEPIQWAQRTRINIYLEKSTGWFDSTWKTVGSSWNYAYKTDTCSWIKAKESGKHRFYLRAGVLPNTEREYIGWATIEYNK
ncbi:MULTISPECIES: hypothetical protein [Bacillus amyloliquefaciens group]|uniref:hypothetical protein n=1 Tax=Bacillus amyloliquefaciens group TaxID=1938374 RepID=UPI00077D77D0|nr:MULTISPECIES: hypothetical protein [Bacillus amyloliquefaciens group]AMQ75632.1 hypothetical protein BAMY6614_03525 [Bacillus amyloliquefaciens UMAF6614]AWM49974.1 hypothetical protein DDT09_19835 [Bacillus amyloliquefaciens]MBF6666420.1 hypothetical protein [Bacillus velezensis]